MIKIFHQKKEEALATKNAVQEPAARASRATCWMQSFRPRPLLTQSALADCGHVGDLLLQSRTVTQCDL